MKYVLSLLMIASLAACNEPFKTKEKEVNETEISETVTGDIAQSKGDGESTEQASEEDTADIIELNKTAAQMVASAANMMIMVNGVSNLTEEQVQAFINCGQEVIDDIRSEDSNFAGVETLSSKDGIGTAETFAMNQAGLDTLMGCLEATQIDAKTVINKRPLTSVSSHRSESVGLSFTFTIQDKEEEVVFTTGLEDILEADHPKNFVSFHSSETETCNEDTEDLTEKSINSAAPGSASEDEDSVMITASSAKPIKPVIASNPVIYYSKDCAFFSLSTQEKVQKSKDKKKN